MAALVLPQRRAPLGTTRAPKRGVNFLLSFLGIGALGLAMPSAGCSSAGACDVACGALGNTFALTVPCGEPAPTSVTVSGPCALGPYAGVTSLTFTSDGTCRVTATFTDGTIATTEVSRQYQTPTPGQCCSGGYQYTGLADVDKVRLGGAPCGDGGGYFGEDAGSDASGE